MASDLDSQQVEIIGRRWLIGELVRAGLEAANPIRDDGVDEVVIPTGSAGRRMIGHAGVNDEEDNPPTGRWRPAIDAIAANLGQDVTVLGTSEMEHAFSCSIRGPEPSGPTLQVAWEGVLGMEYIDGKPDVSASLFLYSRGRRLRLDDQPGSYLELVYEGALDGSGTWRDLGWLADDLGEFEAHDRYGG